MNHRRVNRINLPHLRGIQYNCCLCFIPTDCDDVTLVWVPLVGINQDAVLWKCLRLHDANVFLTVKWFNILLRCYVTLMLNLQIIQMRLYLHNFRTGITEWYGTLFKCSMFRNRFAITHTSYVSYTMRKLLSPMLLCRLFTYKATYIHSRKIYSETMF